MKKKSDLSRAFSEDGALKTHVGGQALLEGVMMRGKFNWAVGVREPQGTIYTEEHDLASGRAKNGWLRVPVVRGCTAFVESLALGYKALEIAATHAFADEDEEDEQANAEMTPVVSEAASSASQTDDQPFSWSRDFGNPDEMVDGLGAQRTLEVVTEPGTAEPSDKGAPELGGESASAADSEEAPAQEGQDEGVLSHGAMTASMVLGLVLGIVLFIVAPAAITNVIVGEYDQATLAWNLVDGLLRVLVFVGYIALIGLMPDIKRMFGYHGAEHKTIHCFEHGLELTPENARSFPRLHVRCGTAFLIMVMVIAILVYTLTPINALIGAWGVPDGLPKLALVIVTRIVLMPVIAGISYEITVKWAGNHPDNPLVKVVLWPGMQMQYLTTREPSDDQIECAIAAMKLVLEREEREAAAGVTARAN
ncbi:metal-dependent enzyme [Denitrobacterium detoxificans]|uniref:Uncharacterized conserved protein YqhQ n=1 Tax=Denitrobacterium detoxificans TaxID=79604 RepID=A0A172RYV5_9ACTN|nr:DUF1385 domain-containing protein [Denitrobacterium detoxificans]ANE22864.1 metal-dependent enzyme [Denitrobacterium detoxificans]SEO69879.1 Uncharacterized conserved protein YqhQ [Denitrobacterium detoxificans]